MYICIYIEPTLHFGDEASLIMLDDLLDNDCIWFDSILLKYYLIYVHQGYLSTVLDSCCVFIWFGYYSCVLSNVSIS